MAWRLTIRRRVGIAMLVFAWRNLMTRPMRTALALVGLSVPILGVIGLFSLSGGLRDLVGDTLGQIKGLMVLRDNAFSPVFSDVKADLADAIRKLPGVRVVAPETWKTAPRIEGVGAFNTILNALGEKDQSKRLQSLLDTPVVQGQDIATHMKLKSGVYPKALLKPDQGGGRFLNMGDVGKARIVIPRKFANSFPVNEPGQPPRPRKVGDSLKIGGKPFEIIGIYETGSMFLDVVIVMEIGVARDLLGISPDTVSSFYVETDDPAHNAETAKAIETILPDIDARSMDEFQENFGMLMGRLDLFLLMTVSLALLVGVVGIINTMLMSTTERFTEFGVLRTNGWSQRNVLALVTAESACLGLLSGLVGCGVAWLGVTIANQFLTGGLQLRIGPGLVALGLALSVVTGTLGGFYPAWRAARMVPMDAIRVGSH